MQQLLFGLLLSRTTEMTARLFEMPLVLRVVSIYVKCTLHDLESTCYNVFHLLRNITTTNFMTVNAIIKVVVYLTVMV